jgi:hypothetical protein
LNAFDLGSEPDAARLVAIDFVIDRGDRVSALQRHTARTCGSLSKRPDGCS